MSQSSITTSRQHPDADLLPPIHPGEILYEEFLKPLGLSQYRLARSMAVPPRRINEIVHGTRSVTADTALRLGRFFGTSAAFWMNLQSLYELELAERAIGDALRDQITPLERADEASA